MKKPIETRLRKSLKKLAKPQSGWTDVFLAVMGKADGTVLTGIPGMVWVRNILNGQTLAVYNNTVSNIPLLQVEVGRRVDTPGLWQVKGTIEPFSIPASGGPVVAAHHEQHEFPSTDTVSIDRKQFRPLTVLVYDAANFIVKLFGAIVLTSDGVVKIPTQTLDLSAYPTNIGAYFIAIESDDTGALSIN